MHPNHIFFKLGCHHRTDRYYLNTNLNQRLFLVHRRDVQVLPHRAFPLALIIRCNSGTQISSPSSCQCCIDPELECLLFPRVGLGHGHSHDYILSCISTSFSVFPSLDHLPNRDSGKVPQVLALLQDEGTCPSNQNKKRPIS